MISDGCVITARAMATRWRWPGDEVNLFTVAESSEPVTCAEGLRVLPERTWDWFGEVDVLVYPGGRGVMSQLGDDRIRARLRRLAEKGRS
jgi:putative intracellular protease/amidase